MTIVKCDKECAYNESGECASDIIWITEIGECDIDEDELNPNKNRVKTELKPCEDWYDVPSDEMTLEQARQAVKNLREKLAEYLEQEPCDDNWRFYYNHGYAQAKRDLSCEDCISRQEAINCVTSNEFRYKIVEDIKTLPSVTPKEKTGYCKDCKWWKDNDGVYRRGIGAESKCPINSKKVYEGNGYCYLFEPQENEVQK